MDEKAVLRFMNKCKHSTTQLLRPVISFRFVCGGVNLRLHPCRSGLMKTPRLLGRLIVYTVNVRMRSVAACCG